MMNLGGRGMAVETPCVVVLYKEKYQLKKQTFKQTQARDSYPVLP